MDAPDITPDNSTTLEEKSILVTLVRETNAKTIVEIGTHRGLTTLYLAEAAKETGGHVYTYDPYDYGQLATFQQYPGFPITFTRAQATTCHITNIDFLFIDGYHEKERVLADIDHFILLLAVPAIIVFHDTIHQNKGCDVRGAIEERGLVVEYLDTSNGLAIYRHLH